jgi:hypothetical protein
VTATRTKAVSLAGSPAHHTHERFARPERARDPRGDRYDHSLAFDPRTSLSKPVRGKRGPIEMAAVAVDDPWSSGKRTMASVNRRVDVLEMERSHGRLTVSQYEVGRQVQAIFERASGARLGSMDFGVRGSKDMTIAHELSVIYAIDDARLVAKLKDKVVRAVGVPGARFLHEVLTGRQTFAQFAEARGKGGERGTAYIAEHFRILMENLDEDFAAEGVASTIQGFTGERTGEETDAKGRLVPAGQGHAWGVSEARYAPQMNRDALALAGRTAKMRDRVAARGRVGGDD